MDSNSERLGSLMAFSDIGLILSTYGVLLAFNFLIEPVSINTWIVCTFFVGIKILVEGIADITGIGKSVIVSMLFVLIADGVIILINQLMAFGLSFRMLLIMTIVDLVIVMAAVLIWKAYARREAGTHIDHAQNSWVYDDHKAEPQTETATPQTQIHSKVNDLFEGEQPESHSEVEPLPQETTPSVFTETENEILNTDFFTSTSENEGLGGETFLTFDQITDELPSEAEIEEHLNRMGKSLYSDEEAFKPAFENINVEPTAAEEEDVQVADLFAQEELPQEPETSDFVTEYETVTAEAEPEKPEEEKPVEEVAPEYSIVEAFQQAKAEAEASAVEEAPQEAEETIETEEVPETVEAVIPEEEETEAVETETVEEPSVPVEETEEVEIEETPEPEVEVEEPIVAEEPESTEAVQEEEVVIPVVEEEKPVEVEEEPEVVEEPTQSFGLIDEEDFRQITGTLPILSEQFTPLSVDVTQNEVDTARYRTKEAMITLNNQLNQLIERYNASLSPEEVNKRISNIEVITIDDSIQSNDRLIRNKLKDIIDKQFVQDDVLHNLISVINKISNRSYTLDVAEDNLKERERLEQERQAEQRRREEELRRLQKEQEEHKARMEQQKREAEERRKRQEAIHQEQQERARREAEELRRQQEEAVKASITIDTNEVDEEPIVIKPSLKDNEIHLQNDDLDIIIDAQDLELLKEFLRQQGN